MRMCMHFTTSVISLWLSQQFYLFSYWYGSNTVVIRVIEGHRDRFWWKILWGHNWIILIYTYLAVNSMSWVSMIIYAPYAWSLCKIMILFGKLPACTCSMWPALILGVPVGGYAPSAGARSRRPTSSVWSIKRRWRKKPIIRLALVVSS